MIWRAILSFIDVSGALALLACMNIITRETTGPSLRDRAWAWLRRTVYAILSFALFCSGAYRVDQGLGEPISIGVAIPHILMVLCLVLFPLLRTFDVITQDRLTSSDGIDTALSTMFSRRRRRREQR